MNLTAPAAVAALETAFLDMLRSESGGFGAFESEARPVALSCCAEAMPRALEERDREHVASRPAGLREHSHRPRALATMCGDVCFRRTVLVDCAGLTRYPINEELDLPAGDHLSPPAPTRWRGCAAGSGRGSHCLPAPASRSGLRDAESGGSASSRSTLPGRRAGA